jgi:hypothetical protein
MRYRLAMFHTNDLICSLQPALWRALDHQRWMKKWLLSLPYTSPSLPAPTALRTFKIRWNNTKHNINNQTGFLRACTCQEVWQECLNADSPALGLQEFFCALAQVITSWCQSELSQVWFLISPNKSNSDRQRQATGTGGKVIAAGDSRWRLGKWASEASGMDWPRTWSKGPRNKIARIPLPSGCPRYRDGVCFITVQYCFHTWK